MRDLTLRLDSHCQRLCCLCTGIWFRWTNCGVVGRLLRLLRGDAPRPIALKLQSTQKFSFARF
jgi:hypothetical protein